MILPLGHRFYQFCDGVGEQARRPGKRMILQPKHCGSLSCKEELSEGCFVRPFHVVGSCHTFALHAPVAPLNTWILTPLDIWTFGCWTLTPADLHIWTFGHLHICTFGHVDSCTFAHLHFCTFAHLDMWTPRHPNICTHGHQDTWIPGHFVDLFFLWKPYVDTV